MRCRHFTLLVLPSFCALAIRRCSLMTSFSARFQSIDFHWSAAIRGKVAPELSLLEGSVSLLSLLVFKV